MSYDRLTEELDPEFWSLEEAEFSHSTISMPLPVVPISACHLLPPAGFTCAFAAAPLLLVSISLRLPTTCSSLVVFTGAA